MSSELEPGLARSDFPTEIDAAKRVAQTFVEAFSSRDYGRLAATLNYPHVRLADGRFTTFENPDQFIQRNVENSDRLTAEGFDHSVLRYLEAMQAGPDKVHLQIINDRCHADGTMYRAFNTLWIVTLQDGHWGIKFRSSYLISKTTG